MPTEEKDEIVRDLVEKLKKAKAIIFTDYRNLGTNDMNILRRKLSAVNADLRVVKNTLLRIALKTAKYPDIQFVGPTASLFCLGDPLDPLKTLVKFAEETKYPTLKMGIIEGIIIMGQELTELAKLPGREILISRIINLLQSPISGITSILEVPQRNLVYILANLGPKINPPIKEGVKKI